MASNFCDLNYFGYLMEYSCLKTLAAKHKSTISKLKKKYGYGKGRWGISYETKQGRKCCCFAKYADSRNAKEPSDIIVDLALTFRYNTTTFEKRLAAKQCELCGATEAAQYEIHHINKVKDLKGKALWEQIMIAKRRKTMVVCENCHHVIHGKRVLQD
jgi:hypothetical protein